MEEEAILLTEGVVVFGYEWTYRWAINKDSERRLPFTI